MKKQNFTGLFLILILLAGAGMTLWAFPQAVRQNLPFDSGGWLNGTNTQAIEKSYDESLPVTDAAIDASNKAGYKLLGEGRDGVLVGTDEWLFSAEEFEKPDGFQENIANNLSYIAAVRDALIARKIQLLVIVLPSKARLYPDHLGRYEFPPHWQAQYEKMIASLDAQKITHVDLLKVFGSAEKKDALYFKTDTHWTPDGARRAAQAVAAETALALPYLSFEKKEFQMVPTGTIPHVGDLTRFIAQSKEPVVTPDLLRVFTLDTHEGGDLFGDTALPIVLVGTSYSANDNWAFANFLKVAFQTDILNQSDEGLGPFEVMQKYLSSDSFKKSPPRLVLWEIPERYLPVHYDLKKP